jgi:hypothetical protein
MYDTAGVRLSETRAPTRIQIAAMSDDGSLVIVLTTEGQLLFLDGLLQTRLERTSIPESNALAIDPHGRYVAVPSQMGKGAFYSRSGKPAGHFEARVPLTSVAFVPALPILIGAAPYGSIVAYELSPGRTSGSLDAELLWDEKVHSKVGRLVTTGDGSSLLAACFSHGVQRYDLKGQNEGSYHLGGTATHAQPDFAGRSILVATQEGQLTLLSHGGNMRWKSSVAQPIVGAELDALGRSWYVALATGELSRYVLDPESRSSRTAESPEARATSDSRTNSPVGSGKTKGGNLRRPSWSIPLAQNDEQAETAVLTVLDSPSRIGAFTNSLRLAIYTTTGESLGQAPEVVGVGRILRTAPGWIAAATDRMIVVLDASQNVAQRVDLMLVETTHLAILPSRFGLAIVQERDRIGRATVSGRWIWKDELRIPVEEIAIGPENTLAITDEEGRLAIRNASGEEMGSYRVQPAEPLCLVDAPQDEDSTVAWITLARRQQILRGHALDGSVVWESPTPFETAQLHRLGGYAVAESLDGRALAYDATGYLRGQSRANSTPWWFLTGPKGDPRRLVRQQNHLLCTDFQDRVIWRAVCSEDIGPLAASAQGVAVMLGRSLTWFEQEET